MPNGLYGGVRGRGLIAPSYSIHSIIILPSRSFKPSAPIRQNIVDRNSDETSERIAEDVIKLAQAEPEKVLRRLNGGRNQRGNEEDEPIPGEQSSQKRPQRDEEPYVIKNLPPYDPVAEQEPIGPEGSRDRISGARFSEEQRHVSDDFGRTCGDHAQSDPEENDSQRRTMQETAQCKPDVPAKILKYVQMIDECNHNKQF